MTVQWGDTGRIAYGTLKTFNISLATPNETLLGTPVASLPTANPGTPQIALTIGNSDLPTITPNSPISLKYTAILYVGGKNTDAASQTINYQCYKNGVAISGATGSLSVATNNFWTMLHTRFFDVQVGDVLGVSLWSASANMNYDYYALVVHPTQMNLSNAYICKDVSYGGWITAPALTKGSPGNGVASNFIFYLPGVSSFTTQLNGSLNMSVYRFTSNSFYSGRLTNGDNSITTSTSTSATLRPQSANINRMPTTISFREILR